MGRVFFNENKPINKYGSLQAAGNVGQGNTCPNDTKGFPALGTKGQGRTGHWEVREDSRMAGSFLVSPNLDRSSFQLKTAQRCKSKGVYFP